jgi:sodium/potassium/calcium exchanger 6
MIPLTIIALFFIFKFICALVDEYIAAAIEFIVKRFKMSDAIAGVTLIALANGAGDVVTAIVSSSGPEGVSYNIGALYGAGLFVCTIVLTFTIKGSPEQPIKVNPMTIYRDVPFFIFATLFVIGNGIYGTINAYTSSFMLVIYLALVVIVYIQDKKEQAKEEAVPEIN